MNLQMINRICTEHAQKIQYHTDQMKQCFAVYEKNIKNIINDISSKDNITDTNYLFEDLYLLHEHLSMMSFEYDIEVGHNLQQIIKYFYSLDDEFTQEFWFKKFKSGVIWPSEKDLL